MHGLFAEQFVRPRLLIHINATVADEKHDSFVDKFAGSERKLP
jgi:hypothetical protein